MNESYHISAVLEPVVSASCSAQPEEPEERFSILVIGDFGGAKKNGPLLVDWDNLDEVLGRISPEVTLTQGVLSFSEMEDFHPDRIYRRCGFLRPRTGADLLEQMIAETGPGTDAAIGDAMRAILHDAGFQALEGAWRALAWLVHDLDTDRELRIFLLDSDVGDLPKSMASLRRSLTAGGRKWGAIVLNRGFGQGADDARALGELGRMAQGCGAPLLSGALAVSQQTGAEWMALRRSPEARWIGLIWPRFLLRLPYGRDTSPVETFAFEEMTGSVNSQYLWGNGAFCCAALLGRSFLRDGWRMRPGTNRRIDGLPVHVYEDDGEQVARPCAESVITDSQAEHLLDNGIMPLAPVKGQDAVVLVRFQSFADPPSGLGVWDF